MRSLLRVVAAVARNRALTGLMVAYAVFSATQNAVWIAMLVYAYDRGGAGTAGAPALEGLARSMEPVELAAGDVLIREGEPGDRFYAIADGRLQVTIGGTPVATNVRGDGIGEIALLNSVPRTATATAASSATVFALSREDFVTAVTGHTPTARAAAAVADERLDQDRHRRSPKPDDPQPDTTSP